MDPTTSKSDPSREAADQGYEPARMSARAMVWFVASFAVAMVVIFWAMHPVMRHLTHEARALDGSRSAVEERETPPPGAPELQPSVDHDMLPKEDLAAMRAKENEVFAHLGWRDDKGRVTVPASVVARVAKRAATQASSRPTTRAGGVK
jgi:hypothetical protein